MSIHPLASQDGRPLELDICFACQGMWIDPQENLKLSPAAVAELFRLLHEQRTAAHQPLATAVHCPRCTGLLTQGFDVVRTGRYITYRCARGHGRFSAFSSFMIEKGFVRLMTQPEIDDLAQRVSVIHCSSCGAPVDLRKDHACPHCRSAFSLLDPRAVERAMQGYAHAVKSTATGPKPHDLADALIMLERDRQQALREQKTQRGSLAGSTVPRHSPKPMRAAPGFSHQPRRMTVSPSARKGACSPVPASVRGWVPPWLSSTMAPASCGRGARDGAGAQQVAALQVAAAHGVLRQHLRHGPVLVAKAGAEISARGQRPGGGAAPSPGPPSSCTSSRRGARLAAGSR
jgi:hypothetical protein